MANMRKSKTHKQWQLVPNLLPYLTNEKYMVMAEAD